MAQIIVNMITNLVTALANTEMDKLNELGKPRAQINDLCDTNQTCRPQFLLEKHMTVLRKGPTMPLTLEMYQFEDQLAAINPVTEGTAIKATFKGGYMDKSANWVAEPQTQMATVTTFQNQRGTTVDGTDISMFYTKGKTQKKAGDKLVIPIDILESGEDWKAGDQLLISHDYTDIYGNQKNATCRCQIINPSQTRWIDDGSGGQDWISPEWSPYSIHGINPATGNYEFPSGENIDPNGLGEATYGAFKIPGAGVNNFVYATVMTMSGTFPKGAHQMSDIYTVELVESEPLFRVKFPKFSYRYKYQDGEYSVFAPWSEIAFIPGQFDYSPKKGYNLGMENQMRLLRVLNWRPNNMPLDVVQIDILYKESNSPNIYTVESFKADDPIETGATYNYWDTPGNGNHYGKYTIKTEMIHKVVASNQLLRPWDNVPRKALAQEITANRLIYANYLQQYNVEKIDPITNDRISIKPEFDTSIESLNPWEDDDTELGFPAKSLKSQRTYQVGVVYRDKYGRETPILTSQSGSIDVPKANAQHQNRLNVELKNDPPHWAESYTFYVKETSNEYYNVAMDRWYDAEDGGVWLSFPSSERNKINEETNLILKKKHDSNAFTDLDVNYKVLSISANAPKFIKTDSQYWGSVPFMLPPPGWGDVGSWDTGMLHPTGLPLPNRMNIDVIAEYFDATILKGLLEFPKAQIRITQSPGVPSAYNSIATEKFNTTDWYDIANISYMGAPAQTYFDDNGIEQEVEGAPVRITRIALERAFGQDALFCESDSVIKPFETNQPNGNLSMSRGLSIEARTMVERDKSQFEGRFFVKILRDANVETNIVEAQAEVNDDWQVVQTKDIKYICAAHPGRQDWNHDTNYYIPPQVQWSTDGGTADPNNGNFTCSSFSKYIAGLDATYVDNSGAVQNSPNIGGKHWPFGPHEDADGVYHTPGPNGNYWNNKYRDFLDNSSGEWLFPDSQPVQSDWPSFAVHAWEPAVHWGRHVGEYSDCHAGNFAYDYLTGSSAGDGIQPSGILDLTLGCDDGGGGGGGVNGQSLSCSPGDPELAPSSWEHNGVPYTVDPQSDTKMGYPTSANPYILPAIWGNQSDFEVGIQHPGVTVSGCSPGGAWPNGCQPFMNLETTSKLRQQWYNLWWGRDKVETTWPLGRFSPDRWFIDKVGAAQGGSGNGIWDDGKVSYMHLSFWGIGRPDIPQGQSNTVLATRHQPTEMKFGEAIAKVGATFRFKQDPDQTIYTVTKVGIEEHVWNYEKPFGSWSYLDKVDPSDNTTWEVKGGGGSAKGMLPPHGSKDRDIHLANGTAFLSDMMMREHEPRAKERYQLTGGAPQNRRVRYTLTLDKIIGSEGPNSFHPIKNHVDAEGKANVKRGRQKYWTSLADDGSITAADGGTPDNINYYNLNSYWNASNGAGDGKTDQPDMYDEAYNTKYAAEITAGSLTTQTWYGDNPDAYIGLHERGLNETTIEIVSQYTGDDRRKVMSNNPAIWETEPKEDVGLDIYYAASPSFPVQLKRHRWDADSIGDDGNSGGDENDTYLANWDDYTGRGEEIVKVGSMFVVDGYQEMRVCDVKDDLVFLDRKTQLDDGTEADIPVGTSVKVLWNGEGTYYGVQHDTEWVNLVITENMGEAIYRVGETATSDRTHKVKHGLGYFNCYSFGTGVESNRIRDDFNAVTIDKGVKASMPLAEQYEEERKGSGLIFSGIYNSTSGINRTNQFIQAEPITKDLNPINGSIQKLFARDTDLVTFCENKVFKILAKKDALFNADGNTNVTSNQAVLGQSIPFSGEYGMSRNPESFASESYRVYFTDKDRGAVLRLSKDGLTPISDAGMKDWFRDNLRFSTSLIGSHDDRDSQYNLTIETADQDGNPFAYTVSYAEKVRGWVSFKSFIQQGGVSHKNIYYTFPSNVYNKQVGFDPFEVPYAGTNHAEAHQHSLDINLKRLTTTAANGLTTIQVNDGLGTILEGMNVTGNGIPIDTRVESVACDAGLCNVALSGTGANFATAGVWVPLGTEISFTTARNRFYGRDSYSMVKVLFNGNQGSVKRFKTLDYEGSQANVIEDLTNVYKIDGVTIGQDYYDNHPKLGWKVEKINTDLQDGTMKEFIDKENKWFNWIRGGEDIGQGDFLDASEFSVQGLGYSSSSVDVINGCTDSASDEYDPNATVDDGSCWPGPSGCTDPGAYNYCVTCTTDDGSCVPYTYGCTDEAAFNYDPNANTDDGSCYPVITGCMDPTMFNYTQPVGNPQVDVNTPCNEMGMENDCCVPIVTGCTDNLANNTTLGANVDDGSCTYDVYGCMDPTMFNYNSSANIDSGNCVPVVNGCTDPLANNYDYTANTDDGSCFYITVNGCTDPTASNYNASANNDDGSCAYGPAYGCTLGSETLGAQTYSNYVGDAAVTNGTVPCNSTDPNSPNYDGTSQVIDPTFDNDCCIPCMYGCTDSTQSNYVSDATCDNGLCIPHVYGCMDDQAVNYNASSSNDDGSCLYTGCTDPTAYNYNTPTYINNGPVTPGATMYPTIDDGSCCYDTDGDGIVDGCATGCTDPNASNYDSHSVYDDGSCEFNGCTDPAASNYDPYAQVDDGSCDYTPVDEGDCFGNLPCLSEDFIDNSIAGQITFNWEQNSACAAGGSTGHAVIHISTEDNFNTKINVTGGGGKTSPFTYYVTDSNYLDIPLYVRIKCHGITPGNTWNYWDGNEGDETNVNPYGFIVDTP